MADAGFQVPAGLLCVTTWGAITAESASSLVGMLEWNAKNGLTNVETRFVMGSLVDKARNEAAAELLKGQAGYLMFLDADMKWEPNLLGLLLQTAYGDPTTSKFDIVGGYCNLRGDPYLPTIDTGTGTWEPHDAGIGPVEVIRTGAACLLIKRHVLEQLEPPWFGIRTPPRPLDALAEVDGYCRQKFDGRNPFSDFHQWQQIMQCAREDAVRQRAATPDPRWWKTGTVGEDSNFCDRAKALGFRILVQTNAICGHLERRVIGPEQHREAMKRAQDRQRWYSGVR